MLKFNNLASSWAKSYLMGALLSFIFILISEATWVIKINPEAFSVKGLDFLVLIDKAGLFFLASVLLISGSISVYSTSYMFQDNHYLKFHLILFAFVLSMFILITMPGILSLLIGWDGLGITSYLLVSYFATPVSNKAGFITLMTNRLGDALIIVSVGLMVGMSLGQAFCHGCAWPTTYHSIWMIWAMAAMTKSAQIPFSAWLPAAMAAPTPVSSLVHSSTLVTAGCYLLIRWFPSLSSSSTTFTLYTVGCLTCCLASIAALVETDFKKMIALSTLSQLGLMFLSLGLKSWIYCWIHLLIHAYFKAVMFMVVGVMIHDAGGYQSLKTQALNTGLSPLCLCVLTTSSFSLMGLPFMAGFYSKDLILENMSQLGGGYTMAIWGLICCLLTSLYAMRLMYMTLSPDKLSKKMAMKTKTEEYSPQVWSTFLLWALALLGGPFLFYSFNFQESLVEWHTAKLSLLLSLSSFILCSHMVLKFTFSWAYYISHLAMISCSFSNGLYLISSATWAKSLDMATLNLLTHSPLKMVSNKSQTQGLSVQAVFFFMTMGLMFIL